MLRPGRRGWLAAVGNPLPVSRGSQAVAARLEASSSAQPASKRERSSGGAGLVLPPALPHQEFRRPKRQRRETRKPAVCSGFVCRGRGSNPHAPLRGQLILSRSEGSPTPSGCRAFRLYDRVHTRSAARVSTAFSGSPTVTSLSPSGAATPGFGDSAGAAQPSRLTFLRATPRGSFHLWPTQAGCRWRVCPSSASVSALREGM
jgi:hypothetical protein